MAFHVPFNQRNQHGRPVVYIGFDTPRRRPRRKFNWWGFNGLWMSLAAFATVGIASPIALIVSLIGLRRPGRKMATAGTLFSLLGIGLITSIVVGGISDKAHRNYTHKITMQKKAIAAQVSKAEVLINEASEELEEYRDNHDGSFPSDIDCNMLMIKHVDPWGKTLRFESTTGDSATIRSSGPDETFNSSDDITISLKGKTGQEILLPLD